MKTTLESTTAKSNIDILNTNLTIGQKMAQLDKNGQLKPITRNQFNHRLAEISSKNK
jgi:hypothetical protein